MNDSIDSSSLSEVTNNMKNWLDENGHSRFFCNNDLMKFDKKPESTKRLITDNIEIFLQFGYDSNELLAYLEKPGILPLIANCHRYFSVEKKKMMRAIKQCKAAILEQMVSCRVHLAQHQFVVADLFDLIQIKGGTEGLQKLLRYLDQGASLPFPASLIGKIIKSGSSEDKMDCLFTLHEALAARLTEQELLELLLSKNFQKMLVAIMTMSTTFLFVPTINSIHLVESLYDIYKKYPEEEARKRLLFIDEIIDYLSLQSYALLTEMNYFQLAYYSDFSHLSSYKESIKFCLSCGLSGDEILQILSSATPRESFTFIYFLQNMLNLGFTANNLYQLALNPQRIEKVNALFQVISIPSSMTFQLSKQNLFALVMLNEGDKILYAMNALFNHLKHLSFIELLELVINEGALVRLHWFVSASIANTNNFYKQTELFIAASSQNFAEETAKISKKLFDSNESPAFNSNGFFNRNAILGVPMVDINPVPKMWR